MPFALGCMRQRAFQGQSTRGNLLKNKDLFKMLEVRTTATGEGPSPHTLLHGPMAGYGDDDAAHEKRLQTMIDVRTFSIR